MKPRLDVLPPPQRRFWPLFAQLPKHFVLYGGTAIGLRLGGRESVDFDFFTNQPISARRSKPGPVISARSRTDSIRSQHLNLYCPSWRRIKISFFGGLSIGRVADPDRCEDNGVFIASLLDLAAQKMKVILAGRRQRITWTFICC